MNNAMERITFLIETLNAASKAYYQGDGAMQVMSDFDYDALYDELIALEAETGVTRPDSPTQSVGYTALGALEKVTHETRMLSLDKTKDVSALVQFLGDKTGLLSWKLDGLTIVLTYKNGVLSRAVTRGNGEIGEDITHNARVFKNLPQTIGHSGQVVIRGEAVISFSDFEKINESIETGAKYKNPRNLCSGTVRQLNSAVTAKRRVQFYAFTVVRADGVGFADSKQQRLVWLKSHGFSVVETAVVSRDTLPGAVEAFKIKIPQNDFATDGLVLTFDSLSHSESLGRTSKFPKDSIALKWADETAETPLLDVEWNTSRTGLINPVAVFEPVELEGTSVSRASLHNVSTLENLSLAVGDILLVYKANMIIPQVAKNLSEHARATASHPVKIPETCPACGFKTEVIGLREARALYCMNPNCKAQIVRALSHFTGRDAMNVEGLSEATLEKFVTHGFVENYTDLYRLEQFEDEILAMEGFGEKSFRSLIAAIEKSRQVQMPNFIYALGIHHVGLRSAKLLCGHFNFDIMEILSAKMHDFCEIQGFGEIMSRALIHYFADEKNKQLLLSFLPLLHFEAAGKQPASNILENHVFVITGSLHRFESRKALQDYIERLGGKVTSAVSAKTTHLINNDVTSNSAKNKAAKALSIPIIDEEQFLKLIQVNDD